jgi:glutathione S-transferase
MSSLILHHYPESPFSEKIRLLLGYKQQSFSAVTIPIIMPKPDLMALTGGYRKTPVLQVDSDIYCDSALICKLIDRLFPENSIYPDAHKAMLTASAHWTDTIFFKVCVAMAFQPKAIANSPLFQDQESAAAFMADRASLSEGSTQLAMEFETANPYFHGHLKRLDTQLELSPFLFGTQPTIVDFSTYHCCWFVRENDELKEEFTNYDRVSQWLDRMAAYGQGQLTEISGETAIGFARDSEPITKSKAASIGFDGLELGETVEVMPIDYGFQPVRGKLHLSSLEELVVLREDERAGKVAVHFPRLGFQVKRASDSDAATDV